MELDTRSVPSPIDTTVMAVYARRSRKEELRPGEQETSTEQQIRACLKFAADHGWYVPDHHLYTESGVSAYLPGVTRARFDDMIAALDRREVAGLVVWKWDRATRNSSDTTRLTNLLDSGVILASVTEGVIDASQPMGSVNFELVGSLNKMFAKTISINAKRGKAALAQTGKPAMGGRRRFGFEADQITHREDEADLLRDAARRLLAGESSSSIVKRWNRDGIRMPGGSYWQVTPLRRVLTNPRVAGLRQHQGQVIGDAAWDAILDRTTWEAVCRHFGTPERRKGGHPAQYLLTGFIWCGHCERQRLFGRTRQGRRLYVCSPQRGGCHLVVSADPLEAWVSARALDLLKNPKVTYAIAQAGADDGRVAALHTEHDDLLKRQRELAVVLANPKKRFQAALDAAQQVETRLAEVKDELSRALPNHRARMALRYSDTPEWSWHAADMDEDGRRAHRRNLLACVFDRIIVHPIGQGTAGRFDARRVEIIPVAELRQPDGPLSDTTVSAIVTQVLRSRS
jgi:site-specific DNA recombinase